MYVTLLGIFFLVFWADTLLGQKKPVDDFDRIQKHLQLREEMHRRMMDKLLRGIGPDQDMFKDMEQLFEESLSESFSADFGGQSFSSSWSQDAKGRTLTISPNDPKQELDISVNNGMITIKGKTEEKSQQGISQSNFASSFSVPGDCDASKVKMDQKDGKILVFFPYSREVKSLSAPGLKPVPKSEDEPVI
jgi:HSP20 family molecular chaperone IbpA